MHIKINARNCIVEATNVAAGEDYVEVAGTVESLMPLGLISFNGRVYTQNYMLVGGAVIERPAADIAREPYSDPALVPETERLREDMDYLLIAEMTREGLL